MSLIQDRVYIENPRHVYFDRETKKQLISWSRFSDIFFPKFDAKKIAPFCAGKGDYVGMTEEQVIKHWDTHGRESADHGTDVHSALETYSKTFTLPEEQIHYAPMVKSIQSCYKDYHKIFDEQILYTKYGIAGTTDKLFHVTSHKNSPFDLEDFKNLKNGLDFIPKEKVRDKWCLFPIEHLPNCNFTKYTLQLSMYAFMYEELSGRKCRKLTIRYIPLENKMEHVAVVVPYMKMEIMMMITEYIRQRDAGLLPPLDAKPAING